MSTCSGMSSATWVPRARKYGTTLTRDEPRSMQRVTPSGIDGSASSRKAVLDDVEALARAFGDAGGQTADLGVGLGAAAAVRDEEERAHRRGTPEGRKSIGGYGPASGSGR